MVMGGQSGYNYNTIRAKLRSKVFLNIKCEDLLDHFHEILKKKRSSDILIKLVTDPYVENQIRYTYLLSKTQLEFGTLFKVISCFICEQMGESGTLAARQELALEREREFRESSLLKREEGSLEEVKLSLIHI